MGMKCIRCHEDTENFLQYFCSAKCMEKWDKGDYGPNHTLIQRTCPDCGGKMISANVAIMCVDLTCGYILCSG